MFYNITVYFHLAGMLNQHSFNWTIGISSQAFCIRQLFSSQCPCNLVSESKTDLEFHLEKISLPIRRVATGRSINTVSNSEMAGYEIESGHCRIRGSKGLFFQRHSFKMVLKVACHFVLHFQYGIFLTEFFGKCPIILIVNESWK